ncbi:hypothetical protein PIB30_031941 [Stylosanthes scabra]|uniref:Uncharacterized protein n=1 Tax=Stylosanthes scabra TaxID=79078 RepID=A0ABU6QC00_9FABA|nr:hypothetical protein [Stylosanthes scabra]
MPDKGGDSSRLISAPLCWGWWFVPPTLRKRGIMWHFHEACSLSEETIFGLVSSNLGSIVVYYEYEAHKEYDNVDIEQTANLGAIKIYRYHFEDKKFSRLVHSGRFDPDRPYEFSITMLGRDCLFGAPRSTPSSSTIPPRAPHTRSRPL